MEFILPLFSLLQTYPFYYRCNFKLNIFELKFPLIKKVVSVSLLYPLYTFNVSIYILMYIKLTHDVPNYRHLQCTLVEKKLICCVSFAAVFLRHSIKQQKKLYNTNAAVYLMPAAYKHLYAAVLISPKHISPSMLRFCQPVANSLSKKF